MSTASSFDSALKRYNKGNPRLKWNVILDAFVTLSLTLLMIVTFNSFFTPGGDALRSSGAVALTAKELVQEIKDEKVVAYWLGPISGSTYTLVTTTKGQAIISYLPSGHGIDNAKQHNLIVETRVGHISKGALISTDFEYTNRDDMTSAGNTFSFDTSVMNFMSVGVGKNAHQVMVYYPSIRSYQSMENVAESLVRIN